MHDIRHLLAFIEVVESGSFTAAARTRGVTVAAISRSVTQLERDVGVRLLQRTTRRLSITDQGRAFYDRLCLGLALMREADEAARSLTQETAGTLRVATPNAFGRQYLLPRLGEFTDAHPAVNVELFFDDYGGNVVARGFDLLIQHGRPKDMGFITRRLMRLPVVLAASPDYLARRGVPRSIEDLYGHQCVVVRFGDGRAFNWQLERTGSGGAERTLFRPEGPTHIFNSLDANVAAAVSGLGIATIDIGSGLQHLRERRLKLLLPQYQLRDSRDSTMLFLVYPERQHMPQRVRLFIDFLTAMAADAEGQLPDLSGYVA